VPGIAFYAAGTGSQGQVLNLPRETGVDILVGQIMMTGGFGTRPYPEAIEVAAHDRVAFKASEGYPFYVLLQWGQKSPAIFFHTSSRTENCQ